MATCVLMQETFKVDNYFVLAYGSVGTLQPHHTPIDESFCLRYPDVLPRATRSGLLRDFRKRVLQNAHNNSM
eukprot:7703555-Prorocentrum_lima.AAC.1